MRWVLVLTVSGAALLPNRALAQINLPPEVVEAAERGRQLFDEGRYQEAIDFLDEAYETYEQPVFSQYIGRCYQELEEYCRAAQNYRRFLRESDPPEAVRSQLQDRLIELDDLCEAGPPDDRDDDPPRRVEAPEDTGPPRRFGDGDDDEPVDEGRGLRIGGVVAMSLGGALFAPGAVLWIAATARYYGFEEGQRTEANSGEWLELARPGDYIGWAGLAILATGVILYLVGRNRRGSSASRRRRSLASNVVFSMSSLGL